ncbi:hypothetical protein [Clostridium botulinum]|uniref:hypothetical protein n=1 Tax=Clostridium botulinum TaxID=1491 RepID=UPI001C9A51E4|nr:hypothetical protein [Clostridium botulinum]MBY6838761.1 hypothetical protein [Clostridium botulinum]
MKKLNDNFEIPVELRGEDVYDMFYIFDNEDEAIDYVVKKYKKDKNSLISELYEEDSMREEYGKENYLRGASIEETLILSELMSGEYILWQVY